MTEEKKPKKSKKLKAKISFFHPVLKRTFRIGDNLTTSEAKGAPDGVLK